MYKKILTITLLTILFFSIICANNFSCALSDVTNSTIWNTWQPTIQDSTSLTNKVEPILGVIRVLGVVISVGTLAFIGIRFMYGSLEEKAKYKEQLVPWIIGATMVFTITTIPSIIYDLTEGMDLVSSGNTTNINVNNSNKLKGNYEDYIKGYDYIILKNASVVLENKYKEEKNGVIKYDENGFIKYLEQQHELYIANLNTMKDKYYEGAIKGLDTAIAQTKQSAWKFKKYVEGYQEAFSEINDEKTVTRENINEAIKNANADWSSATGQLERTKYYAKTQRLISQQKIWEE
jgi:hypothetical protein